MIRLGAALALNLALAAALFAPTVAPRVDPVAPALTRIVALGDRPIGGDAPPGGWRFALDRVIQARGTPEQRRAAAALRPPPPPRRDLRAALQADAVGMARVLGPDRVAAFVGARETLSRSVGEGRVWTRLRDGAP